MDVTSLKVIAAILLILLMASVCGPAINDWFANHPVQWPEVVHTGSESNYSDYHIGPLPGASFPFNQLDKKTHVGPIPAVHF